MTRAPCSLLSGQADDGSPTGRAMVVPRMGRPRHVARCGGGLLLSSRWRARPPSFLRCHHIKGYMPKHVHPVRARGHLRVGRPQPSMPVSNTPTNRLTAHPTPDPAPHPATDAELQRRQVRLAPVREIGLRVLLRPVPRRRGRRGGRLVALQHVWPGRGAVVRLRMLDRRDRRVARGRLHHEYDRRVAHLLLLERGPGGRCCQRCTARARGVAPRLPA